MHAGLTSCSASGLADLCRQAGGPDPAADCRKLHCGGMPPCTACMVKYASLKPDWGELHNHPPGFSRHSGCLDTQMLIPANSTLLHCCLLDIHGSRLVHITVASQSWGPKHMPWCCIAMHKCAAPSPPWPCSDQLRVLAGKAVGPKGGRSSCAGCARAPLGQHELHRRAKCPQRQRRHHQLLCSPPAGAV